MGTHLLLLIAGREEGKKITRSVISATAWRVQLDESVRADARRLLLACLLPLRSRRLVTVKEEEEERYSRELERALRGYGRRALARVHYAGALRREKVVSAKKPRNRTGADFWFRDRGCALLISTLGLALSSLAEQVI